jgi:3-carboxy-cis,cis-muconate cycloisomerase
MKRNLELTGGLIVAEAVMMALAEYIGRGAAHDIVYSACRSAADSGNELITELRRRPEVTAHLDDAALQKLVDPVNYLGSAPAMIDRVLSERGGADQASASSSISSAAAIAASSEAG